MHSQLRLGELARAACRDPDPGRAGPALARIDRALGGAEPQISAGGPHAFAAIGLIMAACAVAATEPMVPSTKDGDTADTT